MEGMRENWGQPVGTSFLVLYLCLQSRLSIGWSHPPVPGSQEVLLTLHPFLLPLGPLVPGPPRAWLDPEVPFACWPKYAHGPGAPAKDWEIPEQGKVWVFENTPTSLPHTCNTWKEGPAPYC